ncbi:MAG: hypothetical protein NTW26_05800 [bacterium]|nr:hypothetical protein [bacterium]
MTGSSEGAGCLLAGLIFPLALVGIGLIVLVGIIAGIFGLFFGLFWFLLKWILGPLVVVAVIFYLIGRANRR